MRELMIVKMHESDWSKESKPFQCHNRVRKNRIPKCTSTDYFTLKF